MTTNEARNHGRRINQLVNLPGAGFMDDCFGVLVGVGPGGEFVEDGMIRCRVPYYKIDREQVIYGPNEEFRVWPGEPKEGGFTEDYVAVVAKRYGDQEYCRLCTSDLRGVPTTLDVPIISCLFLHDHRCLNFEDTDVKLRPLCYNTGCVRKEHWVVEGRDYYGSRDNCPATKGSCNHEPPCCIPGKGYWKTNMIID